MRQQQTNGHVKADLRIEDVLIAKIKPAAYNPRKDLKPDDPEYTKLKKSLHGFGLVEPLVWNKRSGNLVGGHQRFKILVDEGMKKAPCSVVDLSDRDEKALNIALNKHAGTWESASLAKLLEELHSDADFDLEMVGFSEQELAQAQVWEQPETDPTQEWANGMPEFVQEEKGAWKTLLVHFKSKQHFEEFAKFIKQPLTNQTKYIWFPAAKKRNLKKFAYKTEE